MYYTKANAHGWRTRTFDFKSNHTLEMPVWMGREKLKVSFNHQVIQFQLHITHSKDTIQKLSVAKVTSALCHVKVQIANLRENKIEKAIALSNFM